MDINAVDLMTVEAIIGYDAVVNLHTEPFGFSLSATVENIYSKPLYYKTNYSHVETGAMKVLGKDCILHDFAEKARYAFEKCIKKVATV